MGQLNKAIVLVGMMGVGKTSVGVEMAQQLDVPFLDSDDAIVEAAGRSIPEIFSRDGEAFFRAREAEVIRRLLGGVPCILSTGGGAYLSADNRATISEHGLALWLDGTLDLLWSRVRHKNTRPLLMTDNPRATLAALCEARTPFYALADVRFEAKAKLSVAQTAQKVIATISQAYPDVVSDGLA